MNPHARFLNVLVGAAGLTLLVSSPAWAAIQSQYTLCELGEKGRTFWRLDENVDENTPFHGMWEHRNGGPIAHSEWQYFPVSGPTNIEIWGQGTNEWSLYGVVVGNTNWLQRGARCESNSAVVETVIDLANSAQLGRLSPPPLTVNEPMLTVTVPIPDPII